MKKLVYTLAVLCCLIFVIGAALYSIGGEKAKNSETSNVSGNSANAAIYYASGSEATDAERLYSSTNKLQHLSPCLTSYSDIKQGYYNCVCQKNDSAAIAAIKQMKDILNRHQDWFAKGTINYNYENRTRAVNPQAYKMIIDSVSPCLR